MHIQSHNRALRITAWVAVWLFTIYVVGHLGLVMKFKLPDPSGVMRLYYTDEPGGGFAAWGLVYRGWPGVALAAAQLIGHIMAFVIALRSRGTWRTVALLALAAWAGLWVAGVGRVLLLSREWTFIGPWVIPPILGMVGCVTLVSTQRRSSPDA